MNVIRELRRSLEGIIYQWGIDNNVPVIFENIEASTQTATHITTALMPSSVQHYTLKSDEHRGIFQINLFTPQGNGVVNADAMASSVISLYPCGTINGIRIYRPTERTQGRNDGIWYVISISIYYSKES